MGIPEILSRRGKYCVVVVVFVVGIQQSQVVHEMNFSRLR